MDLSSCVHLPPNYDIFYDRAFSNTGEETAFGDSLCGRWILIPGIEKKVSQGTSQHQQAGTGASSLLSSTRVIVCKKVCLFVYLKRSLLEDRAAAREVRELKKLHHPSFLSLVYDLTENESVLYFLTSEIIGTLAMVRANMALDYRLGPEYKTSLSSGTQNIDGESTPSTVHGNSPQTSSYPRQRPSHGRSSRHSTSSAIQEDLYYVWEEDYYSRSRRDSALMKDNSSQSGKKDSHSQEEENLQAGFYAFTELEMRQCIASLHDGLSFLHKRHRKIHRRLALDCLFLCPGSIVKIGGLSFMEDVNEDGIAVTAAMTAGVGSNSSGGNAVGSSQSSPQSANSNRTRDTSPPSDPSTSILRVLLQNQKTEKIAPEIYDSKVIRSTKTDVYSLASCLASLYMFPTTFQALKDFKDELTDESKKTQEEIRRAKTELLVVDLVLKNLKENPDERMTMREFTQHEYFNTEPVRTLFQLQTYHWAVLGLDRDGNFLKDTGSNPRRSVGNDKSLMASPKRAAGSAGSHLAKGIFGFLLNKVNLNLSHLF